MAVRKLKQYRQGDVMLVGRPSMDKTALKKIKPTKDGGVILAEGEVTGHHHILRGENVALFRPDDMPSGAIGGFIEVGEGGATLFHDEHTEIKIEPGIYEQVIQVEDNTVKVTRVWD